MGKLFFPKLAAGNLVRNRQFIFPYLLTGLLTAAMFYNVAFLTWSPDLSNMPGAANIQSIMYVGTVVVGLFAVIFLLYTNSFLMKRRQKEIGLYNILGMSKGHIALILFWETVYTCLITIGGGLLLGILGSTPWPKKLALRLRETRAAVVLQPVFVLAVLVLVTACLVDGSFNPFLYFRF